MSFELHIFAPLGFFLFQKSLRVHVKAVRILTDARLRIDRLFLLFSMRGVFGEEFGEGSLPA